MVHNGKDKRRPENADRLSRLLDLFFPPRCVFCGCFCSGEQAEDICPDCARELAALRLPAGAANAQIPDGIPRKTAVVCRYAGVAKRVVLGVKRATRLEAVPRLARMMLAAAQAEGLPRPDWILPVPGYRGRENQNSASALLAQRLSAMTGVPVSEKLLCKEFPTRQQHTLTHFERQGNLVGAFGVSEPAVLWGKTVWVVDDILTTGATLRECSRTLWLYGAGDVCGVCFAHTVPDGKKPGDGGQKAF